MGAIDKAAQVVVLSFKKGIMLREGPSGCALLQSQGVQIPLVQPSSGFLAALRALSSDGATTEQLRNLIIEHDGVAGLSKILSSLRRLTQRGLICQTVTWPEGRLATLVPMSPPHTWLSDGHIAPSRYVMSRFTYLHKNDEQYILASPLAHATIVLHDWRATALLYMLTQPASLQGLYNTFQDLPAASIDMFVQMLLECRVLSGIMADGQPEEETPTLTQWDFHDLVFHTKSRIGRNNSPCGATFRFLGKIDPLPAIKPPMSDEVISLYKPDIQALKVNDVPFTRVLEARRSIRTHGEQPITVMQLGEFLYRTARIRALTRTAEQGYERSNRPYPSSGACYELELYVIANACAGLPSGLFYYCPKEHQLYRVAGQTREVEALLEEAYHAADQQGMPQILIVLTARFQRVAWKYEAMAYAAILKNVGVLYQTMYLVATAMGLAACALGSGNSDVFAAAAGVDYYVETSVGEFMLGSKVEEGANKETL